MKCNTKCARCNNILSIYLDIQAAFDTIEPTHIRDALQRKGIKQEITDWYYNYITHRNIEININGIEVKRTIKTGFPQGGVCSAKFWIIAFDTAIDIINEHGIQGHGFADDSCAMIAGTNLHHMMNKMQKMIYRLTDWGKSVGLKFNPTKTEVIIFTKSNLKPNKLPNQLLMDDKRVPFSTQTKYLGVTLDSKLLWTNNG